MSDPENAGNEPAASAGDGESVSVPIVTVESRAETAAADEVERKKAIHKHMAGNLGEKTDRGKAINAGRRNPRTDPDFEDHSDESVAEESTEE